LTVWVDGHGVERSDAVVYMHGASCFTSGVVMLAVLVLLRRFSDQRSSFTAWCSTGQGGLSFPLRRVVGCCLGMIRTENMDINANEYVFSAIFNGDVTGWGSQEAKRHIRMEVNNKIYNR
jgi:hypothetical protein